MKRFIAGMLISISVILIGEKESNAFSDMGQHWATNSVVQLNSEGIVSGYLDDTFKPERDVKREEASKMIAAAVEVLGGYSGNGSAKKNVFYDVMGRWSEESVGKLVNQGLISGYPDGSFRPENNMSRSEFCVVINKMLKKYIDVNSPANSFGDTEGHWAAKDISSLCSLDLVNGYRNGNFRPDNNITRAEVAHILSKTLDLVRNKEVKEQPGSRVDVAVIENDKKEESFKEVVTPEYIDISRLDNSVESKNKPSNKNSQVLEVLTEVNKYRRAAGLRDLEWCDDLAYNAEIRAKELNSSFSHTRPNGERGIDLVGYAGENIAYNFNKSGIEVSGLWYNSQGHRDNMLDPQWTRMGVGLYEANGTYYWVQFLSL